MDRFGHALRWGSLKDHDLNKLGLQLRGEAGKHQVEGARIGLAENGGGSIGVEEAAMCIHILERAI